MPLSRGRITAMILRHLYLAPRTLENWAESINWPVVDLLLWGLTTRWIESSQVAVPRLALIVLGLAVLTAFFLACSRREGDSFERAMTAGQGYLEKGDATNAITAYSKAVRLVPESIDARLNLANACLLAGDSPGVIRECEAVLKLDQNNAAAYYLMGVAYLRLNDAEQGLCHRHEDNTQSGAPQ